MKTWFSLKLPEIRCSSVDYSTLSPSPTSYFIRFQTHCEFTGNRNCTAVFFIFWEISRFVYSSYLYTPVRDFNVELANF